MSGGELPPALAAAFSGDTAVEPETVYSRKDKKRQNRQSGASTTDPDDTGDTTPETENPYGDTDTPNHESEGLNNEE